MAYKTKNIMFHVIHVKVSSDSQCSRTFTMNAAIKRKREINIKRPNGL